MCHLSGLCMLVCSLQCSLLYSLPFSLLCSSACCCANCTAHCAAHWTAHCSAHCTAHCPSYCAAQLIGILIYLLIDLLIALLIVMLVCSLRYSLLGPSTSQLPTAVLVCLWRHSFTHWVAHGSDFIPGCIGASLLRIELHVMHIVIRSSKTSPTLPSHDFHLYNRIIMTTRCECCTPCLLLWLNG